MSVDWRKADVPPQRRGFRFLPNPDLGRPEETTRHTSLTMHYFAVSIPS
jgi:hypothetical protein